jgi:hypothetical protein
MRKYSAMLAAAALLVSSGIASAQSQAPRGNDNSGSATSGQRYVSDSGRGTGMTGAPSSSNPQAGGGAGGLTTSPHQVPENGGAPNAVAPNTKR